MVYKFCTSTNTNNRITPDWEALLTQFLTTWPLIRLMEFVNAEKTDRIRKKLKTYSSEHIKAMTKDLSLLLQKYVEAGVQLT
jgi:hypothetical protein